MTVTSDKCPRCAATAKINGYCADCGQYLQPPRVTPQRTMRRLPRVREIMALDLPFPQKLSDLDLIDRAPATEATAVPGDAANH